MGGTDDPAELLFAFFFRYGGVQHSNNKLPPCFRTRLSQYMVVETEDGGCVDLKSCFQIENCETVFEHCWQMLQKRLKGKNNEQFSVLQYMVDAEKLKWARGQCKTKINSRLEVLSRERQPVAAATSVAGLPRQKKKDTSCNQEARELIQGYGGDVQRFLPVEQPASKKKQKSKKNNKKKRQKLLVA